MSETYHAKLFQNGGSQAVRLPRQFRFSGTEVRVHKEGSRVVLEPMDRAWSPEFLENFAGPPTDSFPERAQPGEVDEREELAGR